MKTVNNPSTLQMRRAKQQWLFNYMQHLIDVGAYTGKYVKLPGEDPIAHCLITRPVDLTNNSAYYGEGWISPEHRELLYVLHRLLRPSDYPLRPTVDEEDEGAPTFTPWFT
jgi:hypothetical protein